MRLVRSFPICQLKLILGLPKPSPASIVKEALSSPRHEELRLCNIKEKGFQEISVI